MSAVRPPLDRVIREVDAPETAEYQNLRRVVESSPALMQQMNAAVEQGHLKHFAWMAANENAGAAFDAATQTIHLKRGHLADPTQQKMLSFLLGHELQHGLNRDGTRQGYEQFSR